MAARTWIRTGVCELKVPDDESTPHWVFGKHRISEKESPRDMTEFFYADSGSLGTANFIKIEENAPNVVLFDFKTKSTLEEPKAVVAIVGFIRACQDQFMIQKGDNIHPWRDIPCCLNFFEQEMVTKEWFASKFAWLSPKCNKCGFHCMAHDLRKTIEFVTTVERPDGRRIGYVRVSNA